MRKLGILIFWAMCCGTFASCPERYFRLVQSSEEAELLFDRDGFVSWTNSVAGGTATVEQAVSPASTAAWNRLAGVLVTGQVSELRLFDPFAPANMTLIPAGLFTMGSDPAITPEAGGNERPAHMLFISEMYMDEHEVTKALWDEVYGWAVTNGYSFDHGGEGKGSGHPVHSISWYDMVKWCNARSEKGGRTPAYYTGPEKTPGQIYRTGTIDIENGWVDWRNGYRLPTEAEWEKSARGGPELLRYPWYDFTNRISHANANYKGSDPVLSYDLSTGHHPSYDDAPEPFTSLVGSFSPNGFCLYDVAGNVWEWCWDRYAADFYTSSPANNPIGPEEGASRVLRGGSWNGGADYCRVTFRDDVNPFAFADIIGFRCVLPVASP